MKCKVCGEDFVLDSSKHYIARDIIKTGVFANLVQHDEEQLFDTFDCPACGCQNVIQERKRIYNYSMATNKKPDEEYDCDKCENSPAQTCGECPRYLADMEKIIDDNFKHTSEVEHCFGNYWNNSKECSKCNDKVECEEKTNES